MIPGIPADARLACEGSDDHISEEATDWAKAKRVCQPCPFKAECLRWVLTTENPAHRAGVAGGFDPKERFRLADGRPLIECGTRQGYERHLRRKEKACRLCMDANTTARRIGRVA